MTQDELFKIGLLNAIEELHMNLNGSSDTITINKGDWQYENNEHTQKEYYQALVEKFNNWRPQSDTYSNCVKLLLNAVLTEYERRNK